MKISAINFIPQNIKIRQNVNYVSFCGAKNNYGTDSFEYQNKPQQTKIINPYNNYAYYFPKDIDLSVSQSLKLKTHNKKKSLELDYDPQRTEIIYDKKKRENIEVVVLKSKNPKNSDEFACHIFSKDLKTEYGQVLYSKWDKGVDEVFVKPIDKNIEGIHRLADKYAVQYCKEHKITANISAYPRQEDYRANYKEGKRFVIPEEGSNQYRFFMKNYHNPDPNEIIKNEITDTSKWLPLKMYLPEEKADEYFSTYITDKVKIYNPMHSSEYYIKEPIDITRPKKFSCYRFGEDSVKGFVEFDPNKKGQIYDKKTKTPKDVFILRLHDNQFDDFDSLNFLSTDLKSEYGYAELYKDYKDYKFDLTGNYPKEGIIGDRIIVYYLYNYYDKNYGGIGKLADKAEVKYCIENNIPPNIVSVADDDSHLAHYSRGKRFFQPPKGSEEYDFLMETYGTPNPNKALKELLNKSRKNGQKVDLDKWNEYDFMMYLPKHLVEKYKKEQ